MTLNLQMEEAESQEAVRLRDKATEIMLKSSSSLALKRFPPSKEPKSSYFLAKSLAKMEDEDPIRLQNQSCGIREEIVETVDGEQIVYSSLAHLPTFSIGLASTEGEVPPRTPLRESVVDPKDKSLPRYFQMPKLGARVFIGNSNGLDTIACQPFDFGYQVDLSHLDSENAAVRSLYKDDRPHGLRSWLQAQSEEDLWECMHHSGAILSGTELLVGPLRFAHGFTMVGNLGGKSSRVSSSSSNYKDFTGHKTMRPPSDIVEQPEDLVFGVTCYRGVHWKSVEGPDLMRSTQGLYLEKPKFRNLFDRSKGDHVLQLTRFDDFVILGNQLFWHLHLNPQMVIDIVRKHASETVDVIATQLVKSVLEITQISGLFHSDLITAIVIFLDHKEILQREHKKKKENMTKKYKAKLFGLLGSKEIPQSIVLREDKKIGELKEEEIKTLKKEKKIFTPKLVDEKGSRMEDHKVKTLVSEPMPYVGPVLQLSTVSLEVNELGMESRATSSNLTSTKVQDVSKTSSPLVLIEDDNCKSEDLKVSPHITKWIIYGDMLERTLLCFFNIEEMQCEFYFEDYESMATIIGLGVPHSKVVLKFGNPHVIVVEIQEEDWDFMWAHSNDIPLSIAEDNVLRQERFPNILHHITSVLNTNNIVSKTNNSGVEGDNGKDEVQGNVEDKGKGNNYDKYGNTSHLQSDSNGTPDDNDKGRKGNDENNDKNGHNYDKHGNTSHLNSGSNGTPNDNDKGKKGNDENNDENGLDRDDGKTSNDCKEIQAVVHLLLLPGGSLEEKGKKMEIREEVEEKRKELGKVHEEEIEEKKIEREGQKEVKKKKNLKGLLHALKRGEISNVIEEVENGDVDQNLLKQLDNQIHAQMVFTFTVKDEGGGQLRTTIQASIYPVTFQLPSENEDNYLQSKRFGWFHKKLQVAFGVVDTQVAYLDAKSCRILDSFEAEEMNFKGNSKGITRTNTKAMKGDLGLKHGVNLNIGLGKTGAKGDIETKDIQNSWKINKKVTEGGFSILEQTMLESRQLKYVYLPLFPFNEKEFEVKKKHERLNMYRNPICQLQRVSCEGTWYPDNPENLEVYKLEAYKLEASRELGLTRMYNLDPKTGEEKKKLVLKVEKTLPLCFIQKLVKVVYLNHAMSHLLSSPAKDYNLQERQNRQDPSNSSTTFLTQAQNIKKPNWPSPLIDLM